MNYKLNGLETDTKTKETGNNWSMDHKERSGSNVLLFCLYKLVRVWSKGWQPSLKVQSQNRHNCLRGTEESVIFLVNPMRSSNKFQAIYWGECIFIWSLSTPKHHKYTKYLSWLGVKSNLMLFHSVFSSPSQTNRVWARRQGFSWKMKQGSGGKWGR